MVQILLSLSIFFTSAAQAAEKAGMPQLDPTTWFPQVFWLLITFGFLYLIVEKIVFPRLSDSIEQRNDHVSDNIDEANSIKDQAEKKYQEYLSLISNSKKEAQDLINANKQSLQSNFDNKKKFTDFINEKKENLYFTSEIDKYLFDINILFKKLQKKSCKGVHDLSNTTDSRNRQKRIPG